MSQASTVTTEAIRAEGAGTYLMAATAVSALTALSLRGSGHQRLA